MSSPYVEETSKILEDFLKTLSSHPSTNATLLEALRELVHSGKINDLTSIREVIASLKTPKDDDED